MKRTYGSMTMLLFILQDVLEDEIRCSVWAPPGTTVMTTRKTQQIHFINHGLN